MPEISEENSYAECVLRFAETIGDRLAFTSPTTNYTYRELSAAALHHAAILRDLGVKRGDRVVVLTTPRAESMMLMIAMNMIGAIWVCLNPQYRLREFQYVVEDAQPTLFLYISEFEGRSYEPEIRALVADNRCIKQAVCIDGTPFVGVHLDNLAAEDGRARYEMDFTRDRRFDAAVIVYTSGSSGNPKGAVLPNFGLMERGRGYNEHWPTKDYPRVFEFYPLNHVGGLGWVSGFGLAGGGTIHFDVRFDAETYGETIRRERINVLQGPPTIYQILLARDDFDFSDYEGVEWMLFSGASMPVELLRKMQTLGIGFSPIYGLTEACGGLTFTYPDGDSIETLATTIGCSFIPDEVRVVRPDGTVAGKGEQGEIQIERSRCMLEYFNRPEATQSAFTSDGYFKTGDIAEVGERGYARFICRMSEMFKSGGYNVYPREIEVVLEGHPAVGLAAVISMPDQLYAEVGVAYVVPDTEATAEPTADELRKWCRERMANFKVPKHFIVRRNLPLLPSGKADKVQLRQDALEEPAHTVSVG